MKRTTKAHFEYFKECIKKWLDKFQLLGWTVSYEWLETNGAYAQCKTHFRNRTVTFGLCKAWPQERAHPLTRAAIDTSAKHEVIHLLLSPLDTLACDRFTTEAEINTMEEEIVVKLEQLL